VIRTERLDLVPATKPMLRAAIEDRARLGVLLDARVPATWPPDLLDDDALEWTIRAIDDGNEPEWQMYFIVFRAGTMRTLIGTSGFKGRPSADGTVEIGYGIVTDHQRKGCATETVRALLDFAFADPVVTRVIAETLPDLTASKGVLAKAGFRLIGEGSEPGVIRYELSRPAAS
jgi:ribosomal-protein-alanine N-acetyltransferase